MAAVIERRMIGPAEATDFLTLNVNNRNISQAQVNRYAADMKAGRWQDTGVPIIVYKHGSIAEVIDGQHRLWGVIEAGVTLPFTVSVVDESVVETIDNGLPRTNRDVLKLLGHAEPGLIDRALTGALTLDVTLKYSTRAYRAVTRTGRLAYLEEHAAEVAWCAGALGRIRAGTKVHAGSGLAAGLVHIHRVADSNATLFVDEVAERDRTDRSSGASCLRELIIARPKYGATADGIRRWHNYTVGAWNAYATGRPLSHLRNIDGLAKPIRNIDSLLAAD